MSDRLILAFDTSFGPVSAAVGDMHGRLIAHFEADNAPGTQAETLPPRVQQMFAGADLDIAQVARVAVTVGPGAFTGVRVGLAFAKGLRLATGAEVLGFTTLTCLANQMVQAAGAQPVAVAIDAKRDEIYLQVFGEALAPLTEAQVLPVDDARKQVERHQPRTLTGSGAPLLSVAVPGARVVTAARIDARLLLSHAANADPSRYPAKAAYLRAPDARLPR